MPRLTERIVERAKPRKAKYELSCSVLSGFVLRVLPSGKKAYYVRYRDELGKDRRLRLGVTTELSFAAAVELASAKLHGLPVPLPPPRLRRVAPRQPPPAPGSVASRADDDREQIATAPSDMPLAPRLPAPRGLQLVVPRTTQDASRYTPPAPLRRVPTLADFAERFLQEHVRVHLKPRTGEVYEHFLQHTLLPCLGERRLDAITRADVAKLHASLASTPYAANGNLRLLSSIYSRAIEWGVVEPDLKPPTRGIKKFRTKSRERFLSPEERAKLDSFLEHALTLRSDQPGRLRWQSVAAIRLLALTGMRRDEVLDLTWDMVDEHHRCFRLPDSKTGQKVVPVSDAALEIVRECRRRWETCAYDPKPRNVLFSRTGKRILSCSLTRTWCRNVRSKIPGFDDVRLHDLRHSMASDALMAGVPLAVVGKILGHRRVETTARYAHIADSVLSDAVQTVAQAIGHSVRTGRRRGPRPSASARGVED